MSSAMPTSSGITKITDPFTTSLKSEPGITFLSTNRLKPTGGVIAAISIWIVTITPNQIGS